MASSWWDGMFAVVGGIQIIFKLGFVPEDDELYELTPEQYQRFYDTAGTEADRVSKEKIYMLLPKDPKAYEPFAEKEVFVIKETEILSVEAGKKIIEDYCANSGKIFNSYDEKLRFCASVMPDVFTEGTKYEYHHKKFKSG